MIERLEIFINSLHISMRSFEISIGASNGTIRNAIKKKSDIQSRLLSAIVEKYPQLNIVWLLNGKGNMIVGENETVEYTTKENSTIASASEVKYEALDYREKYIFQLEQKVELLERIVKEKDEMINAFKDGKLVYINK